MAGNACFSSSPTFPAVSGLSVGGAWLLCLVGQQWDQQLGPGQVVGAAVSREQDIFCWVL